jgi:hypothetical protein
MTLYYADFQLETKSGELYILPIAIDAETIEDAEELATKLVQSPSNFLSPLTQLETLTRLWGPWEIDDSFREGIQDRIQNWQGHVRAGRLRIDQFLALDPNNGNIHGLEIQPGNDGVPVAVLNSTQHSLYRVLANSESQPNGEVFVLRLNSESANAGFIAIDRRERGQP